LLLPAELPPGDYQVLVGMYDPATMERLPLVDARGQVAGDVLPLTSLSLPGGAR
jgi:hypothetical protein